MKIFLLKWLLPKLVSNSCDSRIPRTGEEGENVNCFVVAVDHGREPYFVATRFEDNLLVGVQWNGTSYSDAHSITVEEFSKGNIRITHYYGLSEVSYSSVYDLAWNMITKYVYLKIHLYRHFSTAYQYFFNKKKLVTKKRMDLLQFMMSDQIDREHNGIRILDLMTKLYSINWVLHPSADEQEKKLEMYLSSLVDSGDLDKINGEYVVTGKAISTIERYEEEERRHVESVKLQKRMVGLTILLALVAIVQSGLVKLPVILDLTGSDIHNKSMQQTTDVAVD